MNLQTFWEKWLPNRKKIGDEEIIFFLRRHWFILFTKLFFLFLVGLIPVGAYVLIRDVFPRLLDGPLTGPLIVVLVSLYYLFLWTIAFTVFIDYYLDIWIVTTHRIIDREQKGLFNHVVSEQSLGQVQDVSSSVVGIIPTLLNYGDLLIQSAGARNLFHFKQIPKPEFVSRKISQLAQQYRDQHAEHNATEDKAETPLPTV